ISDFSVDPAMPRRRAAERCNLHSAIGIPVSGQEFLGVIELFQNHILPPDPDLLKALTATGAQIGQFLERKRTEQALAESQGLFQGIFQGARDAILLANDSGQIIEGNPAATKLLGRTRDDLLKTHVWDFVPMGSGVEAKTRWAE